MGQFMFNDKISKKEQENIFKIVLIVGCLLILAQCVYMGVFHFPVFRISLALLTLFLSTPFIYIIYKLIKSFKNKQL